MTIRRIDCAIARPTPTRISSSPRATATSPAPSNRSRPRSRHESTSATKRVSARPYSFERSDALDIPPLVMDRLLLLLELAHMCGDCTMFVMLDERMEEGNLNDEPSLFASQLTA